MTLTDVEKVAMAIYWAAYDQYLGSDYTHPKGFTLEVAWDRASEVQKMFCTHQAWRAIEALEKVKAAGYLMPDNLEAE